MIGRFFKLGFIILGWYLVWPAISNAAQDECAVTFGFADSSVLSGVLVDVHYGGTAGEFIGEADEVECYGHVDGALATFNNIAGSNVLKAGLIRIDGFGGSELFTCFFRGPAPSAGDFFVETVDATLPSLEPAIPAPPVHVQEIDCSVIGDGGSDAGLPPPGDFDGNCELSVVAISEAPVSALVVDIDYSSAAAEVVGVGDDAACRSRVSGGLAAFNNLADRATLVSAVVHIDGFEGETVVAECRVDAESASAVEDFRVDVSEALGPDGRALARAPEIALELRCGDGDVEGGADEGGSTDETGRTRDGDAGGRDDRRTGDGGENDGGGGSSDACGSAQYAIVFGVETAKPIGSLQIVIDYDAAPGEFAGTGEHVACEALGRAASGFASLNDLDALERVNGGFVSLTGIDSGSLVSCAFNAGDRAPTAADFTIRVVEATTTDVEPILPAPSVAVVSIDGGEGCDGASHEAVCGNGVREDGEACDDGNESNADACLNDCSEAACGDGHVHSGVEDCDDGNGSDADACLSDCSNAACGDGHVWAGVEHCDGGAGNSDVDANSCRTDCSLPVCGDGVVDSGEACDDGNGDDSDGCLVGCVAAACGDGLVWTGVEDCDDGAANNDAEPEACRTDCSFPKVCGDADGDGEVTATDAKAVLDGAIGLIATCDQSRCDADGSAEVTATDARLVLTASVGLGGSLDCSVPVVVSVDTEGEYGALQIVIDYAETGSTFVGDGENVRCTSLLGENAFASFNNDSKTDQLVMAFVSIEPIAGPIDLAACSFHQPDGELAVDGFVATVFEATDVEANPLDPPDLSISY